MTSEHDDPVVALRNCWAAAPPDDGGMDYQLLGRVEHCYAARSRGGLAALVIPLSDVGSSPVGRRSSGCELIGHTSLRFAYGGRNWEGSAAALLCSDLELVDTFAVLAADVLSRMRTEATWQSILEAVEEWQTLLAPRGRPSPEAELGLWGELWFLAQSADIARGLAGWRGPERDSTDFFIDGVAAEVKTSKKRRQHHVSQSQVVMPVGSHEAWILSLWVKVDPGESVTVPRLVERILERAPDAADALRRIARGGFSPTDRREYRSGFVVLSEPEWYAAASLPRVRAADPGVTHMRYRVVLDEAHRANGVAANRLWQHFHGNAYGGIEP